MRTRSTATSTSAFDQLRCPSAYRGRNEKTLCERQSNEGTRGAEARRRSQPKTVARSKSSPIAEETEVARLTRENARLLSELRENSIKRAIGEVLTIISHSTFDLEKVLNMVLELAARLSEADKGVILRASGNRSYHAAASYQHTPEFMESQKGMLFAPGRSGVVGRVLLDGKSVQIPDIFNDPEFAYRKLAKRGGFRTILGVPLLREGTPIGILVLHRADVRPFTEKQIKLVETFAAQAVIAIENARLLNELRQRTEEVEKLNQQLEQRVADQVGEIERMGRLRRFLPPQVADLIVASGTEKQLESHRREITALFCDLRGFTGFSESADPEDVMALLRDYHAAIGEIIIKYSGTLERYAGDGVMVVFNDPVPVENPALQAVLMALEMRDAIGALTEKWRRLGHDIGFGIGIAHGFATLGTIGFEGRSTTPPSGRCPMSHPGCATRPSQVKY